MCRILIVDCLYPVCSHLTCQHFIHLTRHELYILYVTFAVNVYIHLTEHLREEMFKIPENVLCRCINKNVTKGAKGAF